ncbi:hypothetical protein CMESO_249 (nucleomorph) [Chroomonas mesostigmatica CCMP1168]|nr:hypothetical protein CMESO_249 [Chroomonas mesostigmatica CCMP1168]
MKLIKWGLYCVEIISIASAFGSIYDTLRLRVDTVVHCFAYDKANRCNWGILVCFLGLMTSMYSLTTSVFEEYMRIPEEMKFHETGGFLGFKIGLIFLARRWLYKWNTIKMEQKYINTFHNWYDFLMKIRRFNSMIGDDLRNVRQNLIRANTVQIITFIVVFPLQNKYVRRFLCQEMYPSAVETWKEIKDEWKNSTAPLNTRYSILKNFWEENYPFLIRPRRFIRELNEELFDDFF